MKMQDKDYCPQILEDVEITVLFQNKNGSSYSMGSKSCDRYIQLNDGNKKAVEIAINHMDGKTTIEEIHESMINIYHLNLDVIKLCEWLGKPGF